jgi:hypothetical protein
MTAPSPAYRQRFDGPPRRAVRRGDTTVGRGGGANGKVVATVGALALVAIGAGVWLLGHHGGGHAPGTQPSHHPSPSHAALTVLTPVSAAAFGPSSAAGGSGGDNASEAPLAIDTKPGTDWTTDAYRGSPIFGNLYLGTGLMVDMGKSVSVSSVTVTFGNVHGGHARIEVGNNNTGSVPAGFTTLARTSDATGNVTFTGHPVTGRYVLIWFTKLPQQAGSGDFQADVFNVVVKGTP